MTDPLEADSDGDGIQDGTELGLIEAQGVDTDLSVFIVDADPNFQGTDEWYDSVAKSKPDKNKPWYHVLVHGQGNETYVAESNLTTDDNIDPVDHPFVDIFFYEYDNSGQYSLKQTFN